MSTDRLERGLVGKTEQEDKEHEAREGDDPQPRPLIDAGLARIQNNNHSDLGLNDATVVANPVELCVPLSANGTEVPVENSEDGQDVREVDTVGSREASPGSPTSLGLASSDAEDDDNLSLIHI